jgi:putative membrane protein
VCHFDVAISSIRVFSAMTTASQGTPIETRLTLPPAIDRGENPDFVSVELSARRTGMSFQRTRMSADRTLMSVIRTSLALISFGFTIFQFFQRLQEKNVISPNGHSARNFGMALVYLGVGMVFVGIVYHVQFMLGLRGERADMNQEGLIHAQSRFPISFTLVVALSLLLLGIAAAASLTFRVGPFD